MGKQLLKGTAFRPYVTDLFGRSSTALAAEGCSLFAKRPFRSLKSPSFKHFSGGTDDVESAQDDRELVERGWSALPAEYRIPEQRPTLEEARAYCRRLATTHYENFPCGLVVFAARLRPHFYSIYAYCRIADDLGDEVGNREQSLALLDLWGRELDACYRGEARHPVFVALAETIRACDIPQQPFADLLVAFRQDQTVPRYQTMDDVLDYCRYSANPVGRLVLYACGYRDPEMFLLSDFTCTALQLANFWQDVSSDYARGRIYLPLDDMQTLWGGRGHDRAARAHPGLSRAAAA
jgi:squalene synthase HpnC